MIKMPKFYCPIPSAISPHHDKADLDVINWMDKFKIFENKTQRDYFSKSEFQAFPSRSLPDAKEHLLSLPGKQVMWLQSFDDVYSDEKPGGTPVSEYVVLLSMISRTIESPHTPILLDNPWACALRDLRFELEKYATPAQIDRWIQSNLDYFSGLLWEAAVRSENRSLSVDEYVAMWIKLSGVHACIVFTDITGDYEVSANEWSDLRVKTLREMVAVLVGWDNDLTSYDKEVYRAAKRAYPTVQNLVCVLQDNMDLSVDEAVILAGHMRDRAMSCFLRLSEQVIAGGSENLVRYVRGLGQWVRGYLDYSAHSARYNDSNNPDDASVTNRAGRGWPISDRLEGNLIDLPPLPSISSWWE